MSSASSNNSKRVQQAMASSDTHKVVPATDAATPINLSPAPAKQPGDALALPRHKSHSMDNRPVDPSPIQVSHTVRMAGDRPIGVSENPESRDFSKSKSILNRPIAPNTSTDDDAMVEYLD
jgi:hypothetical protein